MKVAIAGGHGKIAMRLTGLLTARGDAVRSLIRQEQQTDDVLAAGGDPVLCDLEAADGAQLALAIGAVDAVVFAAGAGPGSGPARKESVDFGAAVKLIEAARICGVSRYVMISSVGADSSRTGDDTFSVYLRAKGRADEALLASGLSHTIVRPTRLTDQAGDGLVSISPRVESGSVPRDDVAAVIAASLREAATLGKVFGVTDGDQPVEEALRRL